VGDVLGVVLWVEVLGFWGWRFGRLTLGVEMKEVILGVKVRGVK